MSVLHTMTDEEKSKYKALKTKAVRDYHAGLIEDLGISMYDFTMKSQFLDEQRRLVVGIFPSEFKKTKGLFFELIDSDLNPTDPERKVYRIPPSNSYEEEYELNIKGSYLVPLEELKIVNPDSVAIKKISAVTISDTKLFKVTEKAQSLIPNAPASIEDAPYSEMTIRDFYAIHTGKAVSGKAWLNELIKNK